MANSVQIQFIPTFGQTGPVGTIDVNENSQFAIDFSISDVKDPFTRNGVKSYKFNIKGTKEINALLNHYYDINILDSTYSINKKQKVAILKNGVIVLDNAYMQLLTINKASNSDPYSDGLVSYDVIIGDDVTGFFTSITNKYLSDLDFSDMNHFYNSTNVIATFNDSAIRNLSTQLGGYKYVLPWNNTNNYMLEEMRPSISVYEYWNRIHQAAGYQWDWTGYNTDAIRMHKLWIPYNGDQPKMHAQGENLVSAEFIGDIIYPGVPDPGSIVEIYPTTIIIDTEIT